MLRIGYVLTYDFELTAGRSGRYSSAQYFYDEVAPHLYFTVSIVLLNLIQHVEWGTLRQIFLKK